MNSDNANREFACHDTVRVMADCVASGHSLHKGQVGTVVCKYPRDAAYAVEFIARRENSFVATVLPGHIERAA